ncbi:MAG: hypothetical protein ACREF6_03170, partial [Alphaproteobacteria bacterium]
MRFAQVGAVGDEIGPSLAAETAHLAAGIAVDYNAETPIPGEAARGGRDLPGSPGLAADERPRAPRQ